MSTAVRERPILFSAPMVRAILAGQKTVTRRPVKDRLPLDWLTRGAAPAFVASPPAGSGLQLCRYGAPGDRLWVRETWGLWDTQPADGPDRAKVFYQATDGDRPELRHQLWRPSIHMPRWACRIVLEVTDVRVEQLQDITVEEIIAEGLSTRLREHEACCDLRDQWREGWDGIHRHATAMHWDKNPWVWVVRFRKVEVPCPATP